MSKRMVGLLDLESLGSIGKEKKPPLGEEAKEVLYETGYTKPKTKSQPKVAPKEMVEDKKVSVKPKKVGRRSRTQYKGPILSMRTRPGFKKLFDNVSLHEDYYNVEFIEVLLANYLKTHGMTADLEKLDKLGVEIPD